jgi:hypothetical protein
MQLVRNNGRTTDSAMSVFDVTLPRILTLWGRARVLLILHYVFYTIDVYD